MYALVRTSVFALSTGIIAFLQPATAAETKGEPIVIGVALPLTGDSSEFGTQMKMGIEMAWGEINAAGGIKGRPIELDVKDDVGRAADAQNVATELATNDKVIAVIGHWNSSCWLTEKPSIVSPKSSCSLGSTNVNVTKDTDYVYRNIFTDDFQGESLANYAGTILGKKKIAILFDNDDYGTGLKESFKRRGAQLGLEILRETAYDKDTNDFRSQLTTIQSSSPDVILIAGLYKQGANIARQAKELGIKTQLLGGDGLFSTQYIDLAGGTAEGTFVTCPYLFELGGERAKKFAETFKKKFNHDPDAWSVLGYDAMNIVAKALTEKGVSRAAVLDYLKTIKSPETAYDGLAGKTYFDTEGDCKKPVQVAIVKGGKFVAAERQLPLEGASAPASSDKGTTK